MEGKKGRTEMMKKREKQLREERERKKIKGCNVMFRPNLITDQKKS